MTNYGREILTVAILFVVTLALNLGIEQFFSNRGLIEISQIKLPSGIDATLIRVTNYSNENIDYTIMKSEPRSW